MPDKQEKTVPKGIKKTWSTEQKEIRIKYNQHITILVNVIMVVVVAYYTMCAKGQLEEAKKTNELNRIAVFSNISSTNKSLEMTQETLRTTKASLTKLNENVSILKNTQAAKVEIDYIKIKNIDNETKIPSNIFVGMRNNGTVSAVLDESTFVCAAISTKVPSISECKKLAKMDKEKEDNQKSVKSVASSTLGPSVSDIGYLARIHDNMTGETKKYLKEGKLHLYVKGVIAYSDYASKKKTEFCSQWMFTEDMYPGGLLTWPAEYVSRWTSCEYVK